MANTGKSKHRENTNIDIASLRLLRLLYQELSFSRVAEILEQSQSAVSYTVAKLRTHFDDQLFVRVSTGVCPTERCSKIVADIDPLLAQYDALFSPVEFDPKTVSTQITLSCNGYQRMLIIPSLLKRLQTQAPNLKIKLLTAGSRGRDQLQNGDAEALICPIRINSTGFYEKPLMEDHYVCVMDKHNPLSDTPMNLDAYAKAEHVVVYYGDGWKSPYLEKVESMGIALNTKVEVPTLGDIGRIVPESNLVATVPYKIAQTFKDDLLVVPCPFPSTIHIALYWTSRTHNSDLHRWVRDEITKLTTSLYGQSV